MALLLTAVTLWLAHQQCGLCQQATSSLLTANTLSAAAPTPLAFVNNTRGSTAPEYFVTITEDGDFAVGCQTFYPMGWNQWEWLESGAGAPVLVAASLPPNRTGPWLVRDVMSKGEAAGLNVIRAWATSASPYYALQTSPGNFSEPIFRGLDYALDQARQQNLKVILSLTNNWNSTGSVDQFVSWSPTAHVHEDFFSDPTCMQLYQQYASATINRVNYRLEKVAQKQIREAAKRNDMASAKTLAKELVHTRRMTTRLWTNKAHMMSMNSQLTEQLGMVKVAGTLKQSTQVMKVVNDLIKVPELNQTMQQMSKEMMKAGLIEETMGEMMDDVFDTDDIEEDADAEVDKVLTEIAGETLEQMAAAPKSKAAPARAVAPTQEDEAADAEAEDLQARLNAIRS